MEPTYSELLTEYKKALKSIALGGQSYSIGPRTLTRANLKEVRDTIGWLESVVAAESELNGGLGVACFGDPV